MNNNRTRLLQVQLAPDQKWKWVFCQDNHKIVTTDDYKKALRADGNLEYFQSHYSGNKFRSISARAFESEKLATSDKAIPMVKTMHSGVPYYRPQRVQDYTLANEIARASCGFGKSAWIRGEPNYQLFLREATARGITLVVIAPPAARKTPDQIHAEQVEHLMKVNEQMTEEARVSEEIARPVLEALRSIPEAAGCGRDQVGISVRGGSVYREVLDKGHFTHEQLVAARSHLIPRGAYSQVIREIESADYGRLKTVVIPQNTEASISSNRIAV